jgi:ABC-type branched-subunit amino acid transport system ATPase component
MAEPMLQVRELTKRFGGLTAVDQVDLEVYPGEVVGLLRQRGRQSPPDQDGFGSTAPTGGQIFFRAGG